MFNSFRFEVIIVRTDILKDNQPSFESKIWTGTIILLDWNNILTNTFRIRLERKQRRLNHIIHNSFVFMIFLVQMMIRLILRKNRLLYLEKNIWNIFISFGRSNCSFRFSTNDYWKNFEIKSEKSDITNRPKIYISSSQVRSQSNVSSFTQL